jgi:hypothetical protein
MTRPTEHPSTVLLESLEARWGACLAAGLNERAASVPHDIAERLRIGREQAVARARQQRAARAVTTSGTVGVNAQGSATLGSPGRFWLGLASWLPLALLIAGLVLIQQRSTREQVMAAAEIDAVLLSDDLPPAAWTDPGFREYLKAPRP